MVALLLISVGLFALQNYLASIDKNDATIGGPAKEETILIYRAVRDIPAYTALTPNMFEAITIPKIMDVGFVTDINVITGTFAKGYIFKGNFLTQSSFSTDNFEAGLTHSIEIRADFSGNLAYGDIVDVFAVSNDGQVIPLFANKRLHQQSGQSGTTITKMYVRVTRNELISYFSMLNSHKIAVVPVDPNQLAITTPSQPQQPQQPENPQTPDNPENPEIPVIPGDNN